MFIDLNQAFFGAVISACGLSHTNKISFLGIIIFVSGCVFK
jgi:hypothetical protein